MQRAVAYVRVSSKEQGLSGFGLESQKAQIKAFAEAGRYKIEKTFSEVASAIGKSSVAKRPELSSALLYAKEQGTSLIVARFDRLARHAEDLESLMTSDLEIISIDCYPQRNPLVVKSLAKKVEAETQLLKERTRAGLERARGEGKLLGNRTNLPEAQAKGSEANRRKACERHENLAPAISTIRKSGVSSYSDIAKALNERGISTSRGRPWTKENIRRVIGALNRNERQRQERATSYANVPGFGDW